MNIFEYSIKEKKDILDELKTSIKKGLTEKDVNLKFLKNGYNEIDSFKLNGFKIFIRQFKSAFVYLLIAAIIITIILGQRLDTLMIFIFLAVNTFLGFYQEYRSEKTVQLLNKYTMPKTKVLRDENIISIPSKNLVIGDIIILETGDKVPADVRILEQNNLTINESVLTGESVSVKKIDGVLKEQAKSYYEANNLAFSGTDVLSGKMIAVVLAVGKETVFGNIAKLSTETKRVSDFEKGISHFSNFILKLVAITLVVILLANIIIKKGKLDYIELIIFAIALTVSVIPEALPLVTTFSLSKGARSLAKHDVIVKRLSAVQDLGGIEILCSDKTGTLTKNELKVANIYSDFRDEILICANLAGECDEKCKLEPFDIALWKAIKKDQKKIIENSKILEEEPFNPNTKRNIVLVKSASKIEIITRGAIEEILDKSIISKDERLNIEKWISMEGIQGHRTLAIARKIIKNKSIENIDLIKEKDFEFLGVISFVDPIKDSSYEIVKKTNSLGVKIKIITGDSIEVAGAVAHQIGLIDSPEKVILGSTWENMTRDRKLDALEEYSVFARVSPEQKYKIIELLREDKMIGFLGEGINDAPALKIAGVSIVVNSASDIARESADIILLQKNLTVILDGIKEGRTVFSNTTKYIKATLASNFGNFFAVASTSLLVDFLPMLPVQILLINLLSDTPMISIYTDTADKKELMIPKKYEVKEIVLFSIVLGIVSTIFDFIFFGLFYRISPEVLQTNWFIGSILTELVLIFSVRSKVLFIKASKPSTSLSVLTILAIILTIMIPYTSFGQNTFHFVKPATSHMIIILAIVFIYFICSETVKLMFYKKMNNNI